MKFESHSFEHRSPGLLNDESGLGSKVIFRAHTDAARVVAVACVALILSACGSTPKASGSGNTNTVPSVIQPTIMSTGIAPDASLTPDDTTASDVDTSTSGGTMSQLQALGSAQDYLATSHFSRKGLIDQLSSEYGEGFDVADATWAVDHLTVDWNEQAYGAGQDYLAIDHFSRRGLIEQLTSEYGDQYTTAQATYAVDKLGLK